jgi:hypothetical protein
LSYGFGSLAGLIRLALRIEPHPGAGDVAVKPIKELGSTFRNAKIDSFGVSSLV